MELKPFSVFDKYINVQTENKTCICKKHGEYEAEFNVSNLEQITFCPKCLEEKELKQERENQIKRYVQCNIEPEFYFKTFDNYVAETESQKKALLAVKKMVAEKHGKVILVGSNGVGKTMLASIAAKELAGKIYSMYEISTMIRQSYTIKADKTELEIVRELASIPFLAIDELGRTKNSETEQNWLSYILDKRHSRKLPFMLITNSHFKKFCKEGGCPKCFENLMDNDILSRLHQDCSVVMMNDINDFRKK